MKKLMIAFAAVAMATVAQAVAVDWAASKIYVGDGTTAQADSQLCYLFVNQTMSGETLATQLAAGDFTSLTSSKYEATATAGDVLSSYGYTSSLANGTYDAYMVVFDAASTADATKFYMTEVGSYDLIISGSGDLVDFEKLGNKEASAWTSIAPEPTSGLLLLVGMAGLALRRRRA